MAAGIVLAGCEAPVSKAESQKTPEAPSGGDAVSTTPSGGGGGGGGGGGRGGVAREPEGNTPRERAASVMRQLAPQIQDNINKHCDKMWGDDPHREVCVERHALSWLPQR